MLYHFIQSHRGYSLMEHRFYWMIHLTPPCPCPLQKIWAKKLVNCLTEIKFWMDSNHLNWIRLIFEPKTKNQSVMKKMADFSKNLKTIRKRFQLILITVSEIFLPFWFLGYSYKKSGWSIFTIWTDTIQKSSFSFGNS